uniref:NAD-dependent epimerase/dehydratase family protein n=1 Tax=Gordonia sp. B7-2 TaxID=3420932 RepID=UPI003D93BF15
MRVLITGGAGFLGRLLTRRILDRGWLIYQGDRVAVDQLLVLDRVGGIDLRDDRLLFVQGDYGDVDLLDSISNTPIESIFHLASMMSAESENEWLRSVTANTAKTAVLLDSQHKRGIVPRFVFSSSIAALVDDGTSGQYNASVLPQSTYGITKLASELLIADATRKGIVDGRAARLPTAVFRWGSGNRAASSFLSTAFWAVLNGQQYISPVPLSQSMVVIGAHTAVDGLLALHDLPRRLGSIFTVNLPGIVTSVNEVIATANVIVEMESNPSRSRSEMKSSKGNSSSKVIVDSDPRVLEIVSRWPTTEWNDRIARSLGFPADRDLSSIAIECKNSSH